MVQLEEITEETDMIQALEVSITTSLLELFTEEVTESENRNVSYFIMSVHSDVDVDIYLLPYSSPKTFLMSLIM